MQAQKSDRAAEYYISGDLIGFLSDGQTGEITGFIYKQGKRQVLSPHIVLRRRRDIQSKIGPKTTMVRWYYLFKALHRGVPDIGVEISHDREALAVGLAHSMLQQSTRQNDHSSRSIRKMHSQLGDLKST